MMKMKRIYFPTTIIKAGFASLCLLSAVLTCAAAPQQESEPAAISDEAPANLTGCVKDAATGLPLAGARVSVVNTRLSSMTDDAGHFGLNIPSGAVTLRVEAPGFNTIIVPVRDAKELDIALSSATASNIYDNLLSASASAGKEEFPIGQTVADNSVADIQGDLWAISRSGMPGAGHSVYVDGLHSLNTSSQPLYVVDGIVWAVNEDSESLVDGHFSNPLALISPEDIESIKVLRNGTAIYGARGGNGVVVIETKRAHNEATEIEAWARMGWRSNPKRIPMMNADQYRTYASDIIRGKYDNQTIINRLGFLNDDPTSSQYYDTHNNTNWLDQTTRSGMLMDYGVSVRGGDDRALYAFSLGYAKNDGTVKQTSFDRFNVRFNSDIKLWRGATLRFDVDYAQVNYKLFDDGLNAVSSPYYISMIKSPLYHPNVLTTDGVPTLKLSDVDELGVTNPMTILDLGMGESRNYRFNLTAAPRYQVLDNFAIEGIVAYSFDKVKENSFVPDYGVDEIPLYNNNGEVYAESRNVVKNIMNRRTRFMADLHLEYSPLKNYVNELNLLGGFRYENNTYVTSYGEGRNTSSDYINDLANTSSALHWTRGYDNEWRNMAWYLTGEYSLFKRYMLNVEMAFESASRFGKNAPGAAHIGGISWGFFPSVNAAWLISSEEWMKGAEFIDMLKLRVGYDIAGNDNLPHYANRTYFVSTPFIDNAFGQVISNIGNNQLKWETTATLRAGLDASLFNNRWSFTVDFYKGKTSDLLVSKPLVEETGIEYYWTNGGDLENIGVNFSTTVRAVNHRDWKFDLGAAIGHYKNEVVRLDDGSFTTDICGGRILTEVGQPIGVFYGYKTDGVFTDAASAAEANLSIRNTNGSYTKFQAGDMKFVDNKADGVINEADMQVIGDPTPDFYGNFNFRLQWKNLSLASMFTYSYGNDVYNALRANLESGSDIFNQSTAMVNRWMVSGQDTNIPRAVYGDPMGNSRFSDRWIEDGSYLKWKSLQLDYAIPFSSPYIQAVTLSFAVNNLMTWTNYLGADPEFSFGYSPLYLGVDAGMVPSAREFLFGVKINL